MPDVVPLRPDGSVPDGLYKDHDGRVFVERNRNLQPDDHTHLWLSKVYPGWRWCRRCGLCEPVIEEKNANEEQRPGGPQ
jgi:hypothetical protein